MSLRREKGGPASTWYASEVSTSTQHRFIVTNLNVFYTVVSNVGGTKYPMLFY